MENLDQNTPETEPVKPAKKTVDFVRYLFLNFGKPLTADQIIKETGLNRIDVYRLFAELAASNHLTREIKDTSKGKRFEFSIKADDEAHAEALYEAYELARLPEPESDGTENPSH